VHLAGSKLRPNAAMSARVAAITSSAPRRRAARRPSPVTARIAIRPPRLTRALCVGFRRDAGSRPHRRLQTWRSEEGTLPALRRTDLTPMRTLPSPRTSRCGRHRASPPRCGLVRSSPSLECDMKIRPSASSIHRDALPPDISPPYERRRPFTAAEACARTRGLAARPGGGDGGKAARSRQAARVRRRRSAPT
jgi:hypothetical protein